MGLLSKMVAAVFLVSVLAVTGRVMADNGHHDVVNIKSLQSSPDAQWLNDKSKLEKLRNDNSCGQQWDILWPWVKKGNKEALLILLSYRIGPHAMNIILPGEGGDLISGMRNTAILTVYSYAENSSVAKEYSDFYADMISGLSTLFPFNSPQASEFNKCVSEGGEGCISIAMKDKLVPTFDDFVSEIELFQAGSMSAKCMTATGE